MRLLGQAGGRAGRCRLDVVAGLGAGEDPPLALQQLIGLQHRHGAQTMGLAALADGGDAFAGLPHPGFYLLLQAVGQLTVKGHVMQ